MFRELTYIATILGISSFGTELIFRFKPENKTSDVAYNTQSDMLLASTAIEVILSIYLLKIIDEMTVIKMKIMTIVVCGLLFAAIVLRSQYGFFMPLADAKYNLYNSTSFFLCLTTILWMPFWFFKRSTPLQSLPSIPLTGTLRNRSERRDVPITRSDDANYSGDIDEHLPSYYEVPTPPAYTKISVPDTAVLQEEHTSGTYDNTSSGNNAGAAAATTNIHVSDHYNYPTTDTDNLDNASANQSNPTLAHPVLNRFSVRSTWPRR